MRGRTNITQRALPYVNGDVITAEVESGNTISIGDFVEYKTASAAEDNDFSVNNEYYYNQTLYQTNYLLALQFTSGVTLEIWDRRTAKRINSISFNNCDKGSFTLLENDSILLWHNDTSDSDKVIVKTIIFTNNQLQVINTKEYSIVNDLWNETYASSIICSCISRIDDTHFLLLLNSNNTSTTAKKSVVTVIERSENTLGNVLNKTEIEIYNMAFGSSNAYEINYDYTSINPLDKRVVLGIATSSTSSTRTIQGRAVFLQFDSSYNIQMVYETITAVLFERINKISDNCIIFSSAGICAIVKYNISMDSISKYQITYTGLNSEGVLQQSVLNKNVTLVSSLGRVSHGSSSSLMGTSVIRIEFDENTNNIKVSNSLTVDTDYTSSAYNQYPTKIAFEKDVSSGKIIIGYSMYTRLNRKLNLLYSESDNELSAGVDINYVKQYNSGKAIGFAKTAGNAGENIRIYVPHNS